MHEVNANLGNFAWSNSCNRSAPNATISAWIASPCSPKRRNVQSLAHGRQCAQPRQAATQQLNRPCPVAALDLQIADADLQDALVHFAYGALFFEPCFLQPLVLFEVLAGVEFVDAVAGRLAQG